METRRPSATSRSLASWHTTFVFITTDTLAVSLLLTAARCFAYAPSHEAGVLHWETGTCLHIIRYDPGTACIARLVVAVTDASAVCSLQPIGASHGLRVPQYDRSPAARTAPVRCYSWICARAVLTLATIDASAYTTFARTSLRSPMPYCA
ncbi:hypothetical protein BAUCODRAFT_446763 [Baudoinia panamericana UAMH 10762]|uniref:Uncharacterized protein n=1 Tax=Baudoinia panamericana (strain UAMH 10762) TaxID=717646 RepID=M2N085_BAUPA|nr:uncharacterized protein BAUCODRAFT_446763 [Baudoinia panamericana UAMH 10762]EMC97338.1 hypothetical protein BAUCODRAFT_446763 [Baudoinia panamericana UAMH 10762]